jgi:xanthine dehydrogenase small subunit
MRNYVRLIVNGKEHRVGGPEAFATLGNWLRRDVAATGTKLVCEEGDCGACTVLLRRNGGDFQPVNSCILLLAQLDGASVVTVEGLAKDGALTPLQQSMVACHGAQCGYCTPGFVVAMTALYEHRDRVDEKQVREGLTGNLCRCTGYEPIIKAALEVDGAAMPKIRERYPQSLDARDAVRIGSFFAPATLEDAVRFKGENPGCIIVQGATDVGVWINKRNFTAPAMLSLAKIPGLDELSVAAPATGAEVPAAGAAAATQILAGANVTLAAFEAFIETRIPELFGILNIFGSPQIKNAGTLAGNIANGSPIGDTLPYLFVAGAELELNGGARRVAISDFYLGYKKFDLKADEIITRVRVPCVGAPALGRPAASSASLRAGSAAAATRDHLKLYKVSRRKDLDISAFTAAIRLRTTDGHINAATIAYGGVAPMVVRLPRTEAFLAGKPLSLGTFEEAGRIARGEVAPISDVRGSADYRAQLAENILPKFWYDAFGTP